jgi:tRNA(fMet)-specific endonuclease VapC
MEVNKVLVDTNAYSLYLLGDKNVKFYLEEASFIYLSTIVVGELLVGYKSGSRESANRTLLDKFASKSTVNILNINPETADIYADIFLTLKRKGRLIPTNDMWIAAHTIETGSKLITYDDHFLQIPGLRVWNELKRD